MCTICDFSVALGNPDVTESTLSSTFQSSSSTRVSPEGMPKSLTRPDSGMPEPGLTFQSSSSTRVSPEGMPKSLTRPDSGMPEPGLTFQSSSINWLSHFSGNLSLHNNLKPTINWLSQFSGNLSLQNKIKCTNTWLSQSSGNLSLQCLICWSSTLRRPITNQLQRLNYLVVYTGGHSIIGKNDFYHFLVSTICRYLFLDGYKYKYSTK